MRQRKVKLCVVALCLKVFDIICKMRNFAVDMGRLMAIDFGRKRCGIAVTDTLRIVANPLETVATNELIEFVKKYIAGEKVDAIVVGKPKNLNGEDSESMRYLTPVINKLRKEVDPMPVVFFDERFTSVLAHRAMLDGGMRKMARRDKATVDRISASIILNDYLNSQQNI
jgi:putative Holliday junction resolvase